MKAKHTQSQKKRGPYNKYVPIVSIETEQKVQLICLSIRNSSIARAEIRRYAEIRGTSAASSHFTRKLVKAKLTNLKRNEAHIIVPIVNSQGSMPRNRNLFGCHVELIDFC